MKKLFVLAAATLVMGSVFAGGGKDKKCTKEGKDCCKKGSEKVATKATTAIVKPTAKKA